MMPPETLLTLFPKSKDLLALEPEELAAVLLELIPSVSQTAGFLAENFLQPLSPQMGGGYPHWELQEAYLAVAEAMFFLQANGIIVRSPNQPAEWFKLTRKGSKLRSRADLIEHLKDRALPLNLLQDDLAEKTRWLFARGDHDTAVFQAFKLVEVEVRKAIAADNSLVGKRLMQAAFDVKTGGLSDMSATPDEREALLLLSLGAYGHARNPTGHRDVNVARRDAARLVVLASHLLALVRERASG